MKYSVLFIVFCFFCSNLKSQSVDCVVLSNDLKPIPFANIYYKGAKYGVITNSFGRFRIGLEYKDTLRISCVGFVLQEFICDSSVLKLDTLYLTEKVFLLDQLTVKAIDANKIVKQAIKKIETNYPKKTTLLNGIYKQASISNGHYLGLFESDMNVYINSIESKSKPKIQTKLNQHALFKRSGKFRLIAPSNNIQYLWIRKLPFIDKNSHYKFEYCGTIQYDEMDLYKLKFFPKKRRTDRFQYAGDIYIDKSTHAIVYTEYKLLKNNYGFYKNNGKMQKINTKQYKILFAKDGFLFYPSYVIKESNITTQTHLHGEYFNLYSIFNFFTLEHQFGVSDYDTDELSLHEQIFKNKGERIDSLQTYSTEFILETPDEKKLKIQPN